MSFDKVNIEFLHLDKYSKAFLKEHLAPRTIALLRSKLKMADYRTRAVKRDDQLVFPIKIGRVGMEGNKSRREVKAGEIAYWPQSEALCVFIKDTTTYTPVNVLGLVENLDFFKKLSMGAAVKLRFIQDDDDEEPISI
ncbi:MAG: cyclophilin-like fold protein [Candidatus Hermodarchaeota archaeon]